ncbi:MAG: hypothetical protein V7K18_07325 [Nostoc sp.]
MVKQHGLLKTADATQPDILRQTLTSPFGIWGTTPWWFQELSK